MTSELALRRGDFEEAERLAVDAFDWCYLAMAYLRASHKRGHRCLDHARESKDLVVARNVARIYHRELDDRDKAARVLAPHGQHLLRNPSARGWFLYAAAWDDLGDRDTARDALAHARAIASSAQDWCDVALGFHGIGEPAIAVESIASAERAATTTSDRLSVANATTYALEDPALAHEMLRRARNAAPNARELLQIEQLRDELFGDDDNYAERDQAIADARQRALASGGGELQEVFSDAPDDLWWLRDAERRASSFEDWLALGNVFRIHHVDAERDRCFARAHELALDDAARARLANARSHYDAPLAQRPEQLLPRRDALGYQPDPAPLFDLLRGRVTPEQLQSLASNDYGQGAEEGYPVLLEVCSSGLLPVELPGNLRENVELERWGDGPGTGDHVLRAFACTVMCLAGPGYVGGEEESMSALIDSCITLGDEAVRGLLGLFAAMPEHVFIALGIVLAAARRDPTDPWIRPNIARVVEIDRMRNRGSWPGGFVFGISNFAQRYGLWKSLAKSTLDHPIPHLASFAERLR